MFWYILNTVYKKIIKYNPNNRSEEYLPMIRYLGLKAYGKINLGLDVLRKREDGYPKL